MGIPPYLIAETMNLSLAQRLIRKLCPACKMSTPCRKEDFPSTFIFPYALSEIFKPVGCNACYHTGYLGRKAIYEILEMSAQTISEIKNGKLSREFEQKYITLSQKAFGLLAAGETSLEEIYSILINMG
jgi:general secretion pathway protein E/type IV pilus assembly protein PilB